MVRHGKRSDRVSTINPADDLTDEQIESNRKRLQTIIDGQLPGKWFVSVMMTVPPTKIAYEFTRLNGDGDYSEAESDELYRVVSGALPGSRRIDE